jgi:hypothetical protein
MEIKSNIATAEEGGTVFWIGNFVPQVPLGIFTAPWLEVCLGMIKGTQEAMNIQTPDTNTEGSYCLGKQHLPNEWNLN